MTSVENTTTDIFTKNVQALLRTDPNLVRHLKVNSEPTWITSILQEAQSRDVVLIRGQSPTPIYIIDRCITSIYRQFDSLIVGVDNQVMDVSDGLKEDEHFNKGNAIWVQIDGYTYELSKREEGDYRLKGPSLLLVYEESYDHLILLFMRLDLSQLILSGQLRFFIGEEGLLELGRLFYNFPGDEQAHFIGLKDGPQVISQLIQPVREKVEAEFGDDLNPEGIADWMTGNPAPFPAAMVDKGGRWLFLHRIPSCIDNYELFLDVRDVLRRKGCEVGELLIVPGMADRQISRQVRDFQPDCVCDMNLLKTYFVSPWINLDFMNSSVTGESPPIVSIHSDVSWC